MNDPAPLDGTAGAPETALAGALASRRAIGALAVLTLVNLVNYLDRYVISALVPDLKRAGMGTDFALGLLVPGFLVVYFMAAPVFGLLGDRARRTRSIGLGVLLWSAATAASGFARNYLQLLATRACVGIGEAAYGTIAPSLLADYFPLAMRGRVFAVFGLAIPVGSALGFVVGGLIDHLYGWRAAFWVAGIPGALLGLWVLRLPEPVRGMHDPPATAPPAAPGVRPALALYARLIRGRPYRLTVLGYAAYTFALGGLAFWMPTFLERMRGLPALQATTGFGLIVVLTGLVGTLAGGWLGDYALRFSRQAHLWVSGVLTVLAVPCAVLALAAAAPTLYWTGMVAAELLLFMSTGPINSAIVSLVTPTERASAVALSVFTIHLLGDTLSPPLIGALSDRSNLALAVQVVPIAVALSGVLWLLAARAGGALSPDPARAARAIR